MKEIKILRFENGKTTNISDLVVEERNLNIYIDEQLIDSIVYSSKYESELLFGYLYLEKFINNAKDVYSYEVKRFEYTTNCFVKISKSKYSKVSYERKKIKGEKLFALMRELLPKGETFAKTGGTHISGISDGEKVIAYFEDISRRSTIQKSVGFVLLNSIPNVRVLLTSGRIGFNAVQYAERANIQFIVSQSAPTDLAIETAQENGITLIGFLRGNRFNIYSSHEFVI